ncbi:MAG TPA: hypothetical protein VHY08_07560 [Bacillota bacterium]|nr:hypothetical protein [Bacillota bacterium]
MRIGLIIVVLVLGFAVFRAITTHFICPKCGASFKVGIFNYIFTLHAMNKRMVKCPNCGHTELLAPQWDKK